MKMNIKQKNNASFTMMEIMVYLAVLSVVVLAIYSLFLWTVYSNVKMKALRETLDNNRRVMELITYEMREAQNILAVQPASLSLERADGTIVDFYLCGTSSDAVCFEMGSQDAAFLTSNRVEVNRLNFTEIATSSIRVNLGINYRNPANRPEYEALVAVTSTVSLRPH